MEDKKTAPELLLCASELMAERGKTYDKPDGERSMAKTVEAFNIITGQDMTESQGWEFMSVLKKVRSWQAPGCHMDSLCDDIAYCALKAEAKQNDLTPEPIKSSEDGYRFLIGGMDSWEAGDEILCNDGGWRLISPHYFGTLMDDHYGNQSTRRPL